MIDVDVALKAAELISNAAPETCKEIILPAAKEVGKTLETAGKTVNTLLAPIRGMVWGYEKIIDTVEPILGEKLKSFLESNLKPPEPHIVVPALLALSYSYKNNELREMYANLIANSMIVEYSDSAHPAFVEIIKQLSPLDANIFKEMVSLSGTPVMKIRVTNESPYTPNLNIPRVPKGYDLFSPLAVLSSTDDSNLIAASLENLSRLNLIDISFSTKYSDDKFYTPLENHPFVKKCRDEYEKDKEFIYLLKGCADTNVFGRCFAHTCLESPRPIGAT